MALGDFRPPVPKPRPARKKRPGSSIPSETLRLLHWRDSGMCRAHLFGCTIIGTDPHHLKSRARGGNDSLLNLVLLCRSCHDRITRHEPGTERFRRASWEPEEPLIP